MALTLKYKNPTFDHIIDNIYLGDIDVNETNLLVENSIKIVINISNSRYKENNNISYFHFDIDDNKNENVGQFFDKFNEIISNNKNKNIFIHCMNSVSRSVTLVLYYLMYFHKMTLANAFNYIKSKRTQYTKPNNGFIKQLLNCELELYLENSMKLADFYK